MIRDAVGNTLNEGDQVAFSLGLGQTVRAEIIKIHGGLGPPNTLEGTPQCVIAITMPLVVHPNGVVGGVLKVASPQEP